MNIVTVTIIRINNGRTISIFIIIKLSLLWSQRQKEGVKIIVEYFPNSRCRQSFIKC